MQPRSVSSPTRRRREQRVDGAFRVTIDTQQYKCAGYAENMSSRGIFVMCDAVPPVGSRLNARLLLPGHERPYELTCEVRWHRLDLPGVAPGFGVEFVEDVVGRAAVSTLVDRFLTTVPAEN